jgi:hypothetical protein
MGATDLSAALWQERRELDLLLFRLETQRLHIEAGNLHWLGFTASEVETVLDRLRFEALARNVESAAVAAEWGLPAQASLVELIRAAPEGSSAEILQEHLAGLRDLLRRLSDAAGAGEQLLRKLARQGSSGTTTTPGGAAGTRPGTDSSEILDQLAMAANFERALTVMQRTPQPLLSDYLDGEKG